MESSITRVFGALDVDVVEDDDEDDVLLVCELEEELDVEEEVGEIDEEVAEEETDEEINEEVEEKLEDVEVTKVASDEDELVVEVVDERAKYPPTTARIIITITMRAIMGVAIPLREEKSIPPGGSALACT